MAEFPGSLPDESFFFVDGVTPFQERVSDKIRLPEEIKVSGPFHEEGNNVTFRLLFKNTVIFKGSIPKNGKAVGTLASPVYQPLPIPPEGKPFIIRREEAKARSGPPGKAPRRSLFTEGNRQGKIGRGL
jgi:hypothetical protein